MSDKPRTYTQAEIARQLRELGLEFGDTIQMRLVAPPTRTARLPSALFLAAALDVLGKRGTLFAVTHSPVKSLFKPDPSYVFEPATAPVVTGQFARTVAKWEGAYRSSHPTCSLTAIGPRARDLLGNHDHTSTCFAPMKTLMEMDGKMLLLGCTRTSPGFSTVHLVYEELGLATNSLLSGVLGCYFRKGSEVRWFHQRDVPGCSMGYHKFYPLYRQHGVLRSGQVAGGDALLLGAKEAFAIDKAVIMQDQRFSLCDNPACFSCRATKLFNVADMPRYYLKNGARIVWKMLGKGLAA